MTAQQTDIRHPRRWFILVSEGLTRRRVRLD